MGLLVAAATALRYAATRRYETPWLIPDEFLYAEIGRSIYEHGSLDFRGFDVAYYSLVHPALVGAPLQLADVARGYELAKALQVAVACLAAVPVFAWARSLVPLPWALAAAALSLAATGLSYAGLLVTEVPLYLGLTLASWVLARALVRPSLGAQAVLVAAIVACVTTSLQAAALLPALVAASALFALSERSGAALRSLWPTYAALGAAVAAWCAFRLRSGPVESVFGAYGDLVLRGSVGGEFARYLVYHLGALVLVSGLLPAAALALLAVRLWPRGALTRPERAYVAVALSVTLAFVGSVAFVAPSVELLMERDLIPLAPLLFLALPVWLARGAPRPRIATAAVAAAAVALLALLPVTRFAALASLPNALSFTPLYELSRAAPSVDLDALVLAAGVLAAAAFALASPRALATGTLALGTALAAASADVHAFVADRTRATAELHFDGTRRWIDAVADEPVGYLTLPGIRPDAAWHAAFWNRRVTSVYAVGRLATTFGLPVQTVALEDGTLVPPPAERLLVLPGAYAAGGTALAHSRLNALWRVERPPRLSRR